jgi:hypothetical protein
VVAAVEANTPVTAQDQPRKQEVPTASSSQEAETSRECSSSTMPSRSHL